MEAKKIRLTKEKETYLATRTRAFLSEHPESTVLHLGCGLDTRVYRIDPGPKVRWFDVDLPNVIALREQLYPERDGYRRIGASVTGLTWLDEILDEPHELEKQVPRLHLAEDVEFLTMPGLVERLSSNWFSGAMHGVMGRLPFYRHLVRHLRYAF